MQTSFGACLLDLGSLEKYNFSIALLENSRKHQVMAWVSVDSLIKVLHLGPVSGWAVVVPSHC